MFYSSVKMRVGGFVGKKEGKGKNQKGDKEAIQGLNSVGMGRRRWKGEGAMGRLRKSVGSEKG
jgi:hypothetical protein